MGEVGIPKCTLDPKGKPKGRAGYWYRNLHELLLVATRGQVPAPPSNQRLPSVFHEPAGRHSEKPAAFAELIEAWFPHLPNALGDPEGRPPGLPEDLVGEAERQRRDGVGFGAEAKFRVVPIHRAE
jgi:hypothetical protein